MNFSLLAVGNCSEHIDPFPPCAMPYEAKRKYEREESRQKIAQMVLGTLARYWIYTQTCNVHLGIYRRLLVGEIAN